MGDESDDETGDTAARQMSREMIEEGSGRLWMAVSGETPDEHGDIIAPTAMRVVGGPIYDRDHLVVQDDRPVGTLGTLGNPDPLGVSLGLRQDVFDAIPRLLKSGELRMVPETVDGKIVAYSMVSLPRSTQSWIEQVRHEEEKQVTTRQNQYIHKSCGGGMVIETDINGSWFRCLRCGAETPKTQTSPDPILIEADGGDAEKAKRYDQRVGPEHAATRRMLDGAKQEHGGKHDDGDPTWGHLSPPRVDSPDEMA